MKRLNQRQNFLGADAFELIRGLRELMPIREYRFIRYLPSPSIEQWVARSPNGRKVKKIADRIWQAAGADSLVTREDLLTPIWQAHDFDRFVSKSLVHDSAWEDRARFHVDAKKMTPRWMEMEKQRLGDEKVLAICSQCRTKSGSVWQIPMMDFHCPPTDQNLSRLKKALWSIGERSGAILESGRSYHFYGFRLLTQKQWSDFIARCLLLSPLVDQRYVAHRLLGGMSVLRITSSRTKPYVPKVVSVF